MTFTRKTLTAATAILVTLSAPAFANTFDVNSARLDLSLDTNGDSMVSDDEIIDGNMMVFDFDNNGAIDADERGEAEQLVGNGGMIELPSASAVAVVDAPSLTFDVNAARLDLALDTDGNGSVSDDEIIDGNMMVFDFNSDGAIDASERGEAEQLVATGGMIELPMGETAAFDGSLATEFDVRSARLDLMLDRNGDGTVDTDEIIDGNVAIFDSNMNGVIDANERGEAERIVENS